jgi:hypothetical protein
MTNPISLVFFMFCSSFVIIVVLCIFIFVCTSVGLLPPGESPIAVIIIIIIINLVRNKRLSLMFKDVGGGDYDYDDDGGCDTDLNKSRLFGETTSYTVPRQNSGDKPRVKYKFLTSVAVKASGLFGYQFGI